MKKRKFYNVGMVIIILLMICGGLAAVGSIKGWFKENASLFVSQKTGIVVVERSGVAYEVQKGSVIQEGDILHTNADAQAAVSDNEKQMPDIWLTGGTDLAVVNQNEQISFLVKKGEIFADTKSMEKAAILYAQDLKIKANQAVVSVMTQKKASMIYVYSGKVSVTGENIKQTAAAGQVISIVSQKDAAKAVEVSGLQISTLNAFQMSRLLASTLDNSFCFNKSQLQQLKKVRNEEKLLAQQAKLLTGNASESKEISASDNTQKKTSAETEEEESEAFETERSKTSKSAQENTIDNALSEDTISEEELSSQEENNNEDDTTEKKQKKKKEKAENPKQENEIEETKPEEAKTEETRPEEVKPQESVQYCTIEIRCDTILNNMENLSPGKEAYVPADGTLLAASKVEFTAGETAFDVLKRACEYIGMSLEYSYTPIYESYYVEGINQLYEFDCGSQSGWMYKVNGWFPNYGCSAYQVQKDDAIVFCYTCTGLGSDVGGSNY